MRLRLRQVCLVARDLAPVVEDLKRVFGLEVCHVDPAVAAYGLVNALLPVGCQFLEVVAPTEPGTAAGRYLERRGGGGGYMVIAQCPDLEARRRRVAELGVRIANPLEHGEFRGMQLHPKDTGGAFFEIDCQQGGEAEDGPWHPAGPDWRAHVRTGAVSAILAAELQSPDPERLAQRWSGIAEIPLGRGGQGAAVMPFDNAVLRFVEAADGRGEGLAGLDLKGEDPDAAFAAARAAGLPVEEDVIALGGMRFRIV